MKAFNLAYYWKHIQRVRRGIVHPDVVLLSAWTCWTTGT